MATIPGGIFDQSDDITQIQKDLLSKILDFVGVDETGLQVIDNPDGSTVLLGSNDGAQVPGDAGDITIPGAMQTGLFLFPDAAPGSFIPVTDTGNILLSSTIGNDPGLTGHFSFLSADDSGDNADFLHGAALANNADSVTLNSIDKAIELLGTDDADLVVGYVRLATTPNENGEVRIDATGVDSDTLLAVRLLDISSDSTLVLSGMEKVILVGAGNVRVDDSNGAMLVGDTTNQNITGGDGADSLVGGGGADSLTGGAGDDVFGFIAKGDYTITDFTAGEDVLAFGINGVDSLDDLNDLITSVSHSGGDTTFHFGDNASITLVGVDTDALTADMVKFTIG